jgi:hypothetical protein
MEADALLNRLGERHIPFVLHSGYSHVDDKRRVSESWCRSQPIQESRTAFQREVASRFGLVPNFFSSAPDAPEIIE